MARYLAVFIFGIFSLSAVEIPLDHQLTTFSLKKGIEVWIKEHITPHSQVACRFVGQDPTQGKPQIFDLDCPAEIFQEELPSFLDYCEEEIQKRGGASLGIVAVGPVDLQGLHRYLSDRYDQSEIKNMISEAPLQLIPTKRLGRMDVLLTYPNSILAVQSDKDLKKLWTFYLIQTMAENRFKNASLQVEGVWAVAEEVKYLLPTQTTAGHGIEYARNSSVSGNRLLQSFLEVIKSLKEKGFTESELTDSKSQLIKHLKRFYENNPSEKTLADFYASHLAASIPCSQYLPFMTASFLLIPEINMADIAETLKTSFKDDTRQVVIHHPEDIPLSQDSIQAALKEFASNDVEFKYDQPQKVVIVEGKDPFSQLPITDEEQKLIRSVIQTVAETHTGALIFVKSDLEKKRKQLLHIHPLRSLASMFSDPYTKQCIGKIMDSYFKWKNFISDFSNRMSQEHADGNALKYVPGFCLALKANPDQVRVYINNKEWEKLVKYLIKINN